MKRTLADKERERLGEAFPALALDSPRVPARVTGIMRLDSGVGFSIDLEIPGSYPRGIPKLRCHPKEIPWSMDRHVEPGTGLACLCVSSEYRKHWPPGSDLTDFLEVLVRPYLVGQAYYQAHGRWPPGHERSHGVAGIIEAYKELLAPLESVSLPVIVSFMKLLARKTHPKGHELCPCGSGMRLRNCHRSLLGEFRQEVDPEHAGQDLKRVLGSIPTRTCRSEASERSRSEMDGGKPR